MLYSIYILHNIVLSEQLSEYFKFIYANIYSLKTEIKTVTFRIKGKLIKSSVLRSVPGHLEF